MNEISQISVSDVTNWRTHVLYFFIFCIKFCNLTSKENKKNYNMTICHVMKFEYFIFENFISFP